MIITMTIAVMTPYMISLFFILSVLIMFNSLLATVVSPWIEYRFFNTEFCIWSVCFFKLNLMSFATSSDAMPTCFAYSSILLFSLIIASLRDSTTFPISYIQSTNCLYFTISYESLVENLDYACVFCTFLRSLRTLSNSSLHSLTRFLTISLPMWFICSTSICLS